MGAEGVEEVAVQVRGRREGERGLGDQRLWSEWTPGFEISRTVCIRLGSGKFQHGPDSVASALSLRWT